MKIVLVLPFFSLILITLGQRMEESSGNKGEAVWKNTLKSVMTNLQTMMPTVNERTLKLANIIATNKKPIQDNLQNMKEKISEHMMNAAFEMLEKSLDMAETLQNITNKIKSEVLNIPPIKVVKNE